MRNSFCFIRLKGRSLFDDIVFHLDEKIWILVFLHEGCNSLICLGLDSAFSARPNFGRSLSQDVGRQDVQQGGFVDRFHRVLGEKIVSPIEKIIDIFHDNALLIGAQAQAGDGMWVKGVLLIGLNRFCIDQLIAKLLNVKASKFDVSPIPVQQFSIFVFRTEAGTGYIDYLAGRRVKYVVIPFLRQRKLLFAVQMVGDQKGNMEKYLTIVNAVRAFEIGAFERSFAFFAGIRNVLFVIPYRQ